MEYASGGILGFFGLLLMTGLWIGVVVLGKTGRSAAWWMMLSGLIVATLGIFGYAVSMGFMLHGVYSSATTGTSPGVPPSSMGFAFGMGISGLAFVFGIILFNAGYAMLAFKVSQLAKRAAELESLCASMAAEINRASAATLPGI